MKNPSPQIGDVFGRLTVHAISVVNGKRTARCVCLCGEHASVATSALASGRTVSCGCFRREATAASFTSHGEAPDRNLSPEYKLWAGMIRRCRPGNKNYGDRGVSVCERWSNPKNGVQNFIADMGRRPSAEHSLDRYPDKLGNYEPSNVRWATDEQQARNARSNRMVDINGESITFAEAVERFGKVSNSTARMRVHRGWPDVKAITTPVGGSNV